MPSYRVKGIKKVRLTKKGRTYEYHYHRKTGRRLRNKPGTNAYIDEVARLDALAEEQSQPDLGAMMDAYRQDDAFTLRSAYTRRDYERVMTWLAPMRKTDPNEIGPKAAIEMRDAAKRQHGYRFGGFVVQFCRRLWRWGIQREMVKKNPWTGVELPERTVGGQANPPWTARELVIALMTAPPGLARGLALCAMGRDGADAIRIRWEDIEIGEKDRGKTGNPGAIIVPEALAPVFAGERPSEYVSTNANGRPWKTQNTFTKARRQLMERLSGEGLVRPGLTTHGLRKTLATVVSESGGDLETVRAALQQKTLSMALHYSRTADSRRRAQDAMNALSDALTGAGFGKTEWQNAAKSDKVKSENDGDANG